jgi:hypothetical protein
LDVKKRFTEEQIIGFLRGADAGMVVEDLCHRRDPRGCDGSHRRGC